MTEKELCEAFAASRIEKRRTLISSGACWEMTIPRRVLSQESVDGRYSGKQKMEKIACRVETLDHFVSERGIQRVDLMKIDVEGNEKFVLEGGRCLGEISAAGLCRAAA